MQLSTQFPARSLNDYSGALPAWWGEPIDVLGAQASIIHDAFVSASSIAGWPKSVASRVETSAGEPVLTAEYWRISRISQTPDDLLQQRGEAKRLPGEYTYLGWLIGHYGHFLTESLSRFWYCLDEATPRKFLVHTNYRSFAELPAHVLTALAAFGIGEGNLTLVREPYRVDKLHCPAPAMRCDDSSGTHMNAVYRHLTKSLAVRSDERPRKVYVSRQSLPGDARRFNETEIRDVFERLGFDSIAPEAMSFEDQLSLYANTTHLAGPVGSGMHNAVFTPPGAKALIVAPNSFLFRNDCLLSVACGYPLAYFIADNGPMAMTAHKPWVVDVKALADSVYDWAR